MSGVTLCLGEDRLDEAFIARDFISELVQENRGFFTGIHVVLDRFLVGHDLPPSSSRKWAALNHLTQLPYFRRVWIIQEVRLATCCTLLRGGC